MNPEESRLLLLNAPVLPSSLNSSTGQGTTRIWYTDFFIAVKVYVSIQNSIHIFGNLHSQKDYFEENGAKRSNA